MQYFWYFANCDESNWEEECISFPVSRRNISHITFTVNSSKPNQLWQNCFIKKIFYCSTVIATILFDYYCCFYFPDFDLKALLLLVQKPSIAAQQNYFTSHTVSVKCVFELMRINYLLLMPFVRFRLSSKIRLKMIFVIEDEKSSVCCRRSLD